MRRRLSCAFHARIAVAPFVAMSGRRMPPYNNLRGGLYIRACGGTRARKPASASTPVTTHPVALPSHGVRKIWRRSETQRAGRGRRKPIVVVTVRMKARTGTAECVLSEMRTKCCLQATEKRAASPCLCASAWLGTCSKADTPQRMQRANTSRSRAIQNARNEIHH